MNFQTQFSQEFSTLQLDDNDIFLDSAYYMLKMKKRRLDVRRVMMKLSRQNVTIKRVDEGREDRKNRNYKENLQKLHEYFRTIFHESIILFNNPNKNITTAYLRQTNQPKTKGTSSSMQQEAISALTCSHCHLFIAIRLPIVQRCEVEQTTLEVKETRKPEAKPRLNSSITTKLKFNPSNTKQHDARLRRNNDGNGKAFLPLGATHNLCYGSFVISEQTSSDTQFFGHFVQLRIYRRKEKFKRQIALEMICNFLKWNDNRSSEQLLQVVQLLLTVHFKMVVCKNGKEESQIRDETKVSKR
ncbi:hypothetical protein WN51_08425 [Melipona quadrifasciata]|uniref:Uncharacterized protein n=1 Tax=Melipona quadrifasciata TaxID=166423 RepID=A0A0N0BKB0_9HYME|nr:hypothetical protein WN51_08425 [Melipona quadrifasciata]